MIAFYFVRVGGCLCVSDPRSIQFALGSCYTVHINALSIKYYNENVLRKEQHTSETNTIP